MSIIKPWGLEELLELNSNYAVKKLIMKNGHSCSLQYHKEKVETIYVLSGILFLELNNKTIKLNKGMYITILANEIHRMSAVEGDVEYLETSTPQLTDVIRLKDNYGRI